MSSVATSTKFNAYEFSESVSGAIQAESLAAASNPGVQAIELAHATAFRNGLGSPIFTPSHSGVTVEDIKSFAASAFSKGNVAVLGTGIDGDVLAKLVQKNLSGLTSVTPSPAPATHYFGGETRVEGQSIPTIFIGYGTTAPTAALSVFASLLDPTPSLKWTTGSSPLSNLPGGASAQVVYLPYTDAALFGVVVQAPTAEAVREAGKSVVKALKAVASGSVKDEEVKKAVAKAKFAAASTIESRDGLVSTFGPQVRRMIILSSCYLHTVFVQLLAGASSTLDAGFALFDNVSASSLAKV